MGNLIGCLVQDLQDQAPEAYRIMRAMQEIDRIILYVLFVQSTLVQRAYRTGGVLRDSTQRAFQACNGSCTDWGVTLLAFNILPLVPFIHDYRILHEDQRHIEVTRRGA
jgi:hypothetical protein